MNTMDRNLGTNYIPPDQRSFILAALTGKYGWTPEAANNTLDTVPMNASTAFPPGMTGNYQAPIPKDYARPNGQVTIFDSPGGFGPHAMTFGDSNLGLIEHELHHAYDVMHGVVPGDETHAPPKGAAALARDPGAAGILLRNILSGPANYIDNGDGPVSLGTGGEHVNHVLISQLKRDYDQIPYWYRMQNFGYATPMSKFVDYIHGNNGQALGSY